MPVLPFHNYIGPGNDIDSGPCVDADDCIARQHDIKYENARTAQDVRRADVEAIREFRRNWRSGNWHSLIGDAGLSLKYTVETYTGIIYPKLDAYQCEILPLFHNLLTLHCVNKNKNKPVSRYSSLGENKIELCNKVHAMILCPDSSMDLFFYVLILWYQLCHKYRVPEMSNLVKSQPTSTLELLPNRTHVKGHLVKNSHLLENCDIFHLKTWLRFFSLQKNGPASTDGYNEEEFTNFILNFD